MVKDYRLEFAALVVLVFLILLGLLSQNAQLVALGILLLVILAGNMYASINEIPPADF